ncbi:M10 family metallopeptidase C-terminal domain-containing protein [Humisphaera borealis]|uniref:M10 family metallopeptidase C-terminal domain-containing protein n=1 Tax=Humisphaera borealis TaxID=2807512 RepID=A0A7M2WWA0_9BACT|nr:M10 family metallopeptidase C-terminal domain-containing protein [Humisphaera borealis]QOV89121.1 M10 family metallopeptidase C-terminal domain-containing protein [Humisphaera borealis]
MLLESLESRRLMSVSLSPAGLLTVMGKDDADHANGDTISAYVSGLSLKVNDNGVISTFLLSKVKNIAVYLRAGEDTVTIDPSVKIPCLLDSGPSTFHGDILRGGGGNDTLLLRSSLGEAYGGAGNDSLQNFGVESSLYGEAGNDTLISKQSRASESFYDGGTGVDTLDYSSATIDMLLRNGLAGGYSSVGGPLFRLGITDGVQGMENLFAGSGNDYIYGNASNNILKGNAGNDYIEGGDGNDTIYGGSGEDAMFGQNGNDTFYSKDGIKDFLAGGSGTDKANKDAIDIVNSVEASF